MEEPTKGNGLMVRSVALESNVITMDPFMKGIGKII